MKIRKFVVGLGLVLAALGITAAVTASTASAASASSSASSTGLEDPLGHRWS